MVVSVLFFAVLLTGSLLCTILVVRGENLRHLKKALLHLCRNIGIQTFVKPFLMSEGLSGCRECLASCKWDHYEERGHEGEIVGDCIILCHELNLHPVLMEL